MMMRIKDAEQAQSLAELNRKIAELEIQVMSTARIGDALRSVIVLSIYCSYLPYNNIPVFSIGAKSMLLINVRYFNKKGGSILDFGKRFTNMLS